MNSNGRFRIPHVLGMRLLVVLAVIAATLSLSSPPSYAASQNELIVQLNWDGTQVDASPLPGDCTLPIVPASTHVAGADANSCDGVVQTYDLVQYRVDYNVNEEDQTNTTIEMVLPPNMTWTGPGGTVSPAQPFGMFPGCLPGSTITSSGAVSVYATVDPAERGDILTCVVDTADHEGNNGTIYPTAQLLAEVDGATLTMDATLITDEQPTAATGSVDVVASSSGSPEFVKGPIAEEIEDITNSAGVDGRVFIYPISFSIPGGVIGSPPIDDTINIPFYDHAWSIGADSAGVELATGLVPGRTACGAYDGGGAYPLNSSTWSTCQLDTTATSANGYPTVEMVVDAGSWSATDLVTSNANGTINTETLWSGQIALFVPLTTLEATNPANVSNTISLTDAEITGPGEAVPIEFFVGAPPAATPETIVADNDAGQSFTLDPVDPPGGGFIVRNAHDVAILPGTMQFAETQFDWQIQDGRTEPAFTTMTADTRVAAVGGQSTVDLCGVTGGTEAVNRDSHGQCQVSRTSPLTIVGSFTGSSNKNIGEETFVGCISIDNTHIELAPAPAAIPVNVVDSIGSTVESSGSYTVAPSDGVAHVITGYGSGGFRWGSSWTATDWGGFPYVLEFAEAASPFTQGVTTGAVGNPPTVTSPYTLSTHGVGCDDADAVGGAAGWVTAAALTPADYATMNLVRIRTVNPEIVSGVDLHDEIGPGGNMQQMGASMQVALSAVVKADPLQQTAGQEIFASASQTQFSGDWTGTAPSTTCLTNANVNGPSIRFDNTPWCNLPYSEAVQPGLSIPDIDEYYDVGATQGSNAAYGSDDHTDKLYIVEATLDIEKTTMAPNGDATTLDNGETFEFQIDVEAIGAPTDEIFDVTMSDTMPANLSVLSVTPNPAGTADNPGVDGASATPTCVVSGGTTATDPFSTTIPSTTVVAGQDIECDFGDRYGGWSDFVTIEVMVVGAEADSVITNTAFIDGKRCSVPDGSGGCSEVPAGFDDVLRRQDSASIVTPARFDEAAILKALNTTNTLPGPCEDPSTAAAPASWADAERCQVIQFEDADGSLTSSMGFTINMANEGNVPATNVRFVDVFPFNGDATEPASATGVIGDGRTPPTSTTGTLSLDSFTGDVAAFYITNDPAASISRDPEVAEASTNWCLPSGAAVTGDPVLTGSGAACTVGAETAVYALMNDIPVGGFVAADLILETVGHSCDDIWTNTFGARDDNTLLPIRSNDVSITTVCEFDLALEKVVDPAWTPPADWMTSGSSTVDFMIEVTNQGDPVYSFDVTDYVDTSIWTFDPALNLAGTAVTGEAYSWDTTGTNPVVSVIAPASGLIEYGDVVRIPVTMTISPDFAGGALLNAAEISNFDTDDDPTNGDAASGDLLDVDSTPDGIDDDVVIDGVTDEDAKNGPAGSDEDDHDIALVPLYDLELVKVLNSYTTDTVTFDITVTNQGNQDTYLVDVVEYPPAGLAINAALTTAGLPAGVTFDGTDLFTVAGPMAPADAVTIAVTFDIVDIEEAPFTNTAEISAFDDDADDSNALSPFAVDLDSTPDATNDDDLIDHTEPGYDPDGDDDVNEATPGDEDDHDIAVFTPPVRIGNFVWIDANADGLQDAGEAPVEGVVVNLLDANGDPVLDAAGLPITTTTDANGEYFFDVAPGDYIIEFDLDTLPEDFVVTTTDAGGDDGADSDGDPVTGQTAVISVDPSTLTDTDGDGILDDYTYDLGIVPPVRIGNFVWIDANADGVQDSGELPVEGVVVNLLDANGDPVLDAAGEPITTVTDANGEYFFDVAPGEYIVEFVPPVGTQFTGQDAGDDAADSDADPVTGQTGIIDVSDPSTLTDTDGDGILDDLTHDAGIVPTAQIGNYVWLDSDNDGIQDADEVPVAGVVVNLLDGDGNPVLDAAGEPITAVTDADGFYSFEVPAGDYMIEFDPASLPAGLQFTGQDSGADDAADSDVDPLTGLTAVFNVDPSALTDTDGDGIVDDYTYDAGITDGVEIGDYVWFDENNDGIQDPGETPAAGVTVNLLDADGNPVLDAAGEPITTVTDADGSYSFIVEPGDYQLSFEVPDGYAPTDTDAGDDDSADSDAGPFGFIPTFTVEPGVNDYSLDLGLIELQEISGTVWDDANADGVQDGSETVHEGVLVELLDANGDPVLDVNGDPITALTDANGEFLFAVPPGDYRLRFTAPDGTDLTPGTGGDHDALDGTTGIISVVAGEDVLGIDAGLVLPTTESAQSSPILAFTGRNSLGIGLLALLTIIAGVFLTMMSRRREEDELVS